MLFLNSSSPSGGGGNGSRRRPLTPAEASPTSCSLTMGALCWVLPLEEDEETLEEEEEEEEGGEVFPGVGLLEWLVGLLDEATCCLSCQRPDDSLVLLVNRRRGKWVRGQTGAAGGLLVCCRSEHPVFTLLSAV